MYFSNPQYVQRDSGVWPAQKPAQRVRTEVCVTNTMDRAYVLLDSWVESVETVSTNTFLSGFTLKSAFFFVSS